MPIIGHTGQFSNINEKNYADTTLRIIEGDAAYQSYNPADSHYKLVTTLSDISNVGATTMKTIEFENAITSFTTTTKAGIMNTEPIHTLDLGSNVYIDDTGVDKIYVRGPAYAEELKSESATVTNSVTTRDVITDRVFAKTNGFIGIESNVGLLNTAPVHTLDIGANVQIDEYGSNTFYTSGNAYAEHFKSSNVTVTGGIEANDFIVDDINPRTHDFVYFTSNVGILNTSPIHTLDIGANVQIDEYGSNTFYTSGNVHATKFTGEEITVNGVIVASDFVLSGGSQATPTPRLQAISEVLAQGDETAFSSDRTMTLSNVTTGLDANIVRSITTYSNVIGDNVNAVTVYSILISDNVNAMTLVSNLVGDNVNVVTVMSNVTGDNVVTTGDITGGTTLYVKESTNRIGINNNNPAKELDVTGEVACSSNLTVGTNNLHVDVLESRVGILTSTPQSTLDVHGSANVGDLTATTISGNGALITDIDAGNITTGTISRPVDTTTVTTSDSTFIGSTTRGLTGVTGDYGTVQTTGDGAGNHEGYSINGRYAFVSEDNTGCGIYCNQNGSADLYYDGNIKLSTLEGGVEITGGVGIDTNEVSTYKLNVHGSANVGDLTATTISGDGALITDIDAGNITTGTISRPINTSSIIIDDYVTHDGDADTKFGFPDTDTFAITTGSTERMRVDSYGNVAIGTNTISTARLNIEGNVNISSGYTFQIGGNDVQYLAAVEAVSVATGVAGTDASVS